MSSSRYPQWVVKTLRETLMRLDAADRRLHMIVEAYPDGPDSKELVDAMLALPACINIVARAAGKAERG